MASDGTLSMMCELAVPGIPLAVDWLGDDLLAVTATDFTDSSFRVPSIYLNDWPDRYIHTTSDVPGNIDPAKLERAAFICAASAGVLPKSCTTSTKTLR